LPLQQNQTKIRIILKPKNHAEAGTIELFMNNSLFAELVIETESLFNKYFGGEQEQSDEN